MEARHRDEREKRKGKEKDYGRGNNVTSKRENCGL
jgi:hypothetical protein